MYYVCVENEVVTAVLNYKPNVPESVKLYHITDEEQAKIESDTHYFDMVSKTVVSRPQEHLDIRERQKQNISKYEYLRSTDWVVMRHIREKALGLETSISEEEYLELEAKRQEVSKSIVK